MIKKRYLVSAIVGAAVIGGSLWCLGSGLYRKIIAVDKKTKRTTEELKREEQIPGSYLVSCKSDDGLLLRGYWKRQIGKGHRWAVCIHGYRGYPEQMNVYGRAYAERGYSVLLPALRGHGESEGTYIGMGVHDRLDILCWIRWILIQDPEAEIVLHGVSMGAATAMLVAGETLPSNVRAVVEDCGYTTAREEFLFVAAQRVPKFLMGALPLLSATIWRKAGYRIRDAAPLEAIKRTDVPILFIHGADDDFVPSYMASVLYEAAGGPKELYLQPGAGHTEAVQVAPEDYWEHVDSFLKRYWETRKQR